MKFGNLLIMKKLILVFLLGSVLGLSAQNYVDLLKVNQGQVQNAGFEGQDGTTMINDFNLKLTYPIKISEKRAIITGVDYGRTELKLAPSLGFTALHSITGKLGLSNKYSEKWSGTYVLLPKIAADLQGSNQKNFQMGGFALLTKQTTKHFKYKMGLYGSTENFGMFVVPFFGFYYKSPNQKLEINTTLPIYFDLNYKVNKLVKAGFDFNALVRAYNLNTPTNKPYYVHKKTQELLGYLQFGFLKNSVILQTKLGYSFNNYEKYQNKDKLDFGLSAFEFGKDRTLFNPEMKNALSARIRLVYRYHLPEKPIIKP